MQWIEPGITKSVFCTSEPHFWLSDATIDVFGPNIGVDGHNLTILFLSLNRTDLSMRLLRSIADHLPHFRGEILIADNGSDIEELVTLKQFLDKYLLRWRLLEFGRNFGVAGGRNKAIAEVTTDWVLSLDNDVYFVANPLPQIQRDLAVLGCHFLNFPLLNPDCQTLFAFGGVLWSAIESGRPRLSLHSILHNAPIHVVKEFVPAGDGFLCTFLYGTAAVINRHTFKRLGGFDENMFIGFEDIDFSLRLFREGMKVGTSNVLALVHDHAKPENSAAEDYERLRHKREILEGAARYLEAKHGFVIWAPDVEEWMRGRENKLQLGKRSTATPSTMINEEGGSQTRRPRIALITDFDNWAFANISRQLIRYLGDRFEFEIISSIQVAEIEQARRIKGHSHDMVTDLYMSSFCQILLLAEDFDIVHVFWRPHLGVIDTPLLEAYARSLGMSYHAFRKRFIENRIFSTCIYDHLFLSEDDQAFFSRIFKEIVAGYYVCSERLAGIYRNIPSCPPPDVVIEDGVDLELFKPSRLDRFDDISQREVVIGWVGNSKWASTLEDFKGVHTILIPAVEELRQEGLQVRLHLADRQHKYISHHLMPRYYSEIDVYVCTSKIEGTPNPVLEAMACGVPVISTDVGIVPQVFGPLQREFILAERSIACLKEALRRLITNAELFRKLSAENLKSIKPWDWRHKVEKFALFFERLLQRKAVVNG